MPIRFRCPHCTRLLGIARRKVGTQINCPECHRLLTVPAGDGLELDDLDAPFNPQGADPSPRGFGDPARVAWPEPSSPVAPVRPQPPKAVWPELPVPVAPVPVAPVPPQITPTRPPTSPRTASRPPRPAITSGDAPLFEQEDVDALLGLKPGVPIVEVDEPGPRRKAVSGMDANSLDYGDDQIVLTTQKVTLLIVGVVVLLGMAFAAGFLIASR